MDLGHMQTHPLWGSAPGQQLEEHKWHTVRKWIDWKQGECWETASSWENLLKSGSGIVPSLSPPPTQSHKVVKWVALPRQSSKALYHTIYRSALLQWATLLRQGIKAALPNTQKQTQGGCQIEETKKYGPTEITEQNSRKIIKQNRDNQHIRCRVQNTGYQDAQRTHWVLQQHKKCAGRSDSYINEEKSAGNQQRRGRN